MEQKNKKKMFVVAVASLGAFVLGIGLFQVSWALPIIKKPVELPPGFNEMAEIQRCNNVKVVAGRKYSQIVDIARRDEDIYDNLILRMEDMSYNLSNLGYDVSSLRQIIGAFHSVRSEFDSKKSEVIDLFVDLQYSACSFTPEQRREKVKKVREAVDDLQEVGVVIKREGWLVLNDQINQIKNQK